VVKNKVAPPFRASEFDIMYGEGISREGDLVDQGAEHGIIEKSGAWYSYKGERIGQGRENAKQFLKDNPDVRKDLDTELRRILGLLPPVGASAPPEAAKPAANTKAAVRG
jgi:recombination protein RecA